jgi:hypothetical protein
VLLNNQKAGNETKEQHNSREMFSLHSKLIGSTIQV